MHSVSLLVEEVVLSQHEAIFHNKKKTNQERHAKVVFSTRRLATNGHLFLLKCVFRTSKGESEKTQLFQKHGSGFVFPTIHPPFCVDKNACFAQQVIHYAHIRDFARMRGEHTDAFNARFAHERTIRNGITAFSEEVFGFKAQVPFDNDADVASGVVLVESSNCLHVLFQEFECFVRIFGLQNFRSKDLPTQIETIGKKNKEMTEQRS